MEIIYKELGIELTRRCNEKCAHCLRGDALDVDLSKEIIDSLFDNNDIRLIENLLLSGGEPTMNGQALSYLVDKIIEKRVVIGTYRVIINGTYYDPLFGDAIKRLHEYIDRVGWNKLYNVMYANSFGRIGISQDQYHKEVKQEVLDKLNELPSKIIILDDEYNSEKLLPYGRAFDNSLSSNIGNLSKLTDIEGSYIINKYGNDGIQINKQYICANGNVCLDPNYPFKVLDEYRIGNVLEGSILDMYGIKKEISKWYFFFYYFLNDIINISCWRIEFYV